MDPENLINELKNTLNYCPGLVNGPNYSISQRQLGELYFEMGIHLESIYHFSEAHAVSLRQIGLFEMAQLESGRDSSNDPLSFHSDYANKGVEGMLKRLEEMPPEWTIVQLTRKISNSEIFSFRTPNTSPLFKDFFLTRFSCGTDVEKNLPVVVKLSWPEDDLIKSFLDFKEKLGQKKGTSTQIRKMRQAVSLDLQRQCREIGPLCFKEWLCLLLGKLYSKTLQDEIRDLVDNRLENSAVNNEQRYLCYLLAEGSCHLENKDIEVALYQIFEENENLALRVLETLVRIKESFGARLHVAKRHPVLLILDDHLDNISWESISAFKRHPVSRIYSLHIAHSLYKAHKDYIVDGLREIDNGEICYYIVNPDGNLPTVEEKIPTFLRKRFPHWIGIVGKKPSEEELIKALTQSNSYVYCGHGSGSQYLSSGKIQQLKVAPLQLLFGCSSVAFRDLGGINEMHGDVMEYALARSGCTLGMLWPVTCNDTDKITMILANICMPGTPVDINTFEPVEGEVKKESELLRALRDVRDCVDLFSNGAALVARGIPIKLVHNNGKNW